jgi:non-specific serine/threonine protein kinase
MTDKATAPNQRPAGAVRFFGRFQLLRLLGKSARSMAWAVSDPQSDRELILVLPRKQPVGSAALERWNQRVQRAARLNHPNVAAAAEIGVQDGWPFVAYEVAHSATLAERLTTKGLPPVEIGDLIVQALRGLAFAHEGGVVHHDPQNFLLLIDDQGQLRVAGFEVAADEHVRAAGAADAGSLQALRQAAERDVLALGVLLHHGLAGQPALDERDAGRVIERLPPLGRDIVRLPWNSGLAMPEALRAIVNRATDRQERQRYRNARTLARALEGWLTIQAGGGSGALVLLQDKLRAAGVLPSSPGAGPRAARLALMERERTNELAEVVLQDLALTFDLLRTVNTARVRGVQVSGNGPVLTVRRAIAMIGLEGVRRASLSLRPWPGPLQDAAADELGRLILRVKRAGRLAMALRPPGYDAEVVYLVTLLQNLGRLVVQYHFAEDAAQIHRLMQPAPSSREGEADDPGMNEDAASFAVLGAAIEDVGAAVARQWGLEDGVLTMIRRLSPGAPVHHADEDDATLRIVASAANETVDALGMPAAQVALGLQHVVQRYGRALNLTLKDLQTAIQDSVVATRAPAPVRAAADTELETPSTRAPEADETEVTNAPPAVPMAPPTNAPRTPGSLRAAAAERSAR